MIWGSAQIGQCVPLYIPCASPWNTKLLSVLVILSTMSGLWRSGRKRTLFSWTRSSPSPAHSTCWNSSILFSEWERSGLREHLYDRNLRRWLSAGKAQWGWSSWSRSHGESILSEDEGLKSPRQTNLTQSLRIVWNWGGRDTEDQLYSDCLKRIQPTSSRTRISSGLRRLWSTN